MSGLLPHALAGHAAGLSIVPVAADGTKMPAVAWKAYQASRADEAQVRAWFRDGHPGLGVICGAVSGNLEMLELEGRAVTEGVLERLVDALADHGLTDLWQRLNSGYLERTPSGGLHWLYRVDGPARGNLKLARRPATDAELASSPLDRTKVLIETRGEGGFSVLAPSHGPVHATGQPWTVLAGSLTTIPQLSLEERDALHAVAQMLDRMPAQEPPVARKGTTTEVGDRPGDDYNARTDWSEILLPLGWREGRSLGRTRTWIRPGKTDPGISATTGRNDGDNLYVFSSSVAVFDTETPYTKFHAYALLEHGGDFAAAAKALRGRGYGKPLEPSRPSGPVSAITGLPIEGNLATVAALPAAAPRPQLEVVEEATLDRSDDGNALRLVDTFGDRIRYVHDRGRWIAWDGQRWQWCERGGGVVREYAKRIARALPEDDRAATTHKRRSLGSIGTTAMLIQAQTDNRIAVSLADLDAHPYELNTPGGIVDLRTGRLRPADPARLHTRLTACSPDPGTDPRRWQQFLDDTFNGEQALIGYLRRLVGYSAIGKVGAHVLPFCHGSGGNGKGVFLEALAAVLGDYATTAPSGFLMKQMVAKHETEIARLAGARLVICSEVNEDDVFDEAKVKLLTGGDSLTARFMNQDHFTFTPTHQLWLVGNNKPAVRSGGRSFWRRLRLIGFEHEVPAEKMIDDLQGILAAEHGPALLAWVVAGAAEYHAEGLRDPRAVLAATEGYAHDQDTVTRFIEERCHLGGGAAVQIKVTLVREAYESWCRESGEVPVSAKAFGIGLQRRGITTSRTKAARFYQGMTLVDDSDEPADRGQGW